MRALMSTPWHIDSMIAEVVIHLLGAREGDGAPVEDEYLVAVGKGLLHSWLTRRMVCPS